jgi:hypothetical protein
MECRLISAYWKSMTENRRCRDDMFICAHSFSFSRLSCYRPEDIDEKSAGME